ncbi:MAG: Mut7-C RNAse domain-containing protein [Candidatus Thorarchaeota archaeon]
MRTFIVDAMLGKLATWLRLAGYDTFYSTKIHDDQLLQIALDQNRVLLTSDAILARRAENAGAAFMLVRGSVDEEVAIVFSKFEINPKIDPSKSRCTKCNGVLTHITDEEKETIRRLVAEQTFNHYSEFWLCRYCSSVFFQGGQWTNIEAYMERITQLMKELER